MVDDERWERISASKVMYGVFDVEQPYEATPVALFRFEEDANEWVEAMRKHPDEDRRLSKYDQVFPVRAVEGEFWNSYDPCQELAAPPDPDRTVTVAYLRAWLDDEHRLRPEMEVIVRVQDDDGATMVGGLTGLGVESGCTEVDALMLDGMTNAAPAHGGCGQPIINDEAFVVRCELCLRARAAEG